ncbi:MAG: YfiR/HmsC family protein, partial [Rhodocyclaceae bacterium]
MEVLTDMRRAVARLRADARSAALAASCVALIYIPAAVAAADGDSLEYTVKATYLFKFGIYVDWPSGTFSSPSSPLNLCIVGDDP